MIVLPMDVREANICQCPSVAGISHDKIGYAYVRVQVVRDVSLATRHRPYAYVK